MRPVLIEEAHENLKKALAAGDFEEVKKWDMCIRGENDIRIRAKQKQSQAQMEHINREIRRSYTLP